ncbi:MAG: hypothetical protein A2V67_11045 [Deltaproteobacteria bacterium RBG_13_61_14]|nr:MAG: hypothetical protein A2V67_11045 [Deltaproteobacteria bacterium RBG_13_61_14]
MDKLDDLLKGRFRFDPLYTLAILKVSHDLRTEPLAGFEEILEDTLTDFNLDRSSLEFYVAEHREALVATCREMGI